MIVTNPNLHQRKSNENEFKNKLDWCGNLFCLLVKDVVWVSENLIVHRDTPAIIFAANTCLWFSPNLFWEILQSRNSNIVDEKKIRAITPIMKEKFRMQQNVTEEKRSDELVSFSYLFELNIRSTFYSNYNCRFSIYSQFNHKTSFIELIY